MISLALWAAQKEQGASDEDVARLREAVRREKAAHNIWLKGFF